MSQVFRFFVGFFWLVFSLLFLFSFFLFFTCHPTSPVCSGILDLKEPLPSRLLSLPAELGQEGENVTQLQMAAGPRKGRAAGAGPSSCCLQSTFPLRRLQGRQSGVAGQGG